MVKMTCIYMHFFNSHKINNQKSTNEIGILNNKMAIIIYLNWGQNMLFKGNFALSTKPILGLLLLVNKN